MKNCILCGEKTNGSVGRAGLKWSFICQKCKDEEDMGLERMLNYQNEVMNKIESFLIPKNVVNGCGSHQIRESEKSLHSERTANAEAISNS